MPNSLSVLATVGLVWAAGLFAATLPPSPSLWLGFGAIAVMTTVAMVWYGFVACVLTARSAAAMFTRVRHWIDRVAGVACICLGVRLATDR